MSPVMTGNVSVTVAGVETDRGSVIAGVDLATVTGLLLGHHSLEMTCALPRPCVQAAAVAKLAAALADPRTADPAAAVAGSSVELPAAGIGAKAAPDPARFRHVFSGRQTPAKQKYLSRSARWKVEAGGIEPPSEGDSPKVTTCLAYVLMSGLRLP